MICGVSANVPTMAGGASNEISVLKTGRLHQIVMQNRLPTVTLTQTVSYGHEYLIEPAYIYICYHQAGANLQQQFRVFHRGGAGFRNLALQ